MGKQFSKDLKDKKATTLVEQYEINKKLLRFFAKQMYLLNSKISVEDKILLRETIQKIMNSFPRKSSVSKLVDSSSFTGRSRGYYRYPKMGRMEFKYYAGAGALPGFRKSSW